ncbi:MAG: TspO/MBR family protein [Candidatus Nanopelagicales bacterium]
MTGDISGVRRAAGTAWVQAAVLAGAQLAVGSAWGRPDDPAYYRALEQAPFAPPSWVFGPAWVIAKSGTSYAAVRTLRGQCRGKGRLLTLFAADAAVFVTFSYVYFRRRSPVLAAVWTVADAALTAVLLADLARQDSIAAAAVAPQAAWLSLAAPTAVWQAATNPDPLLGTPALTGSHA